MIFPFLAHVLKLRIPRWIYLPSPGGVFLPGIPVPVFHQDEREVPEEFRLDSPEEPELASPGRSVLGGRDLGRTQPRVVSADPLCPAQPNCG